MKFVDYKDNDIQIDLTTLTIARDPQNPTRLIPHHCSKCGKFVGQITGFIYRESDSDPGIDLSIAHPVYIIQCKNCYHKYLITNIL